MPGLRGKFHEFQGPQARWLTWPPAAWCPWRGKHSRQGNEYILVLLGGYTCATASYAPKDLKLMEAGQPRNPVADPGEDRIDLAVNAGRPNSNRLIHKIAAALFGS